MVEADEIRRLEAARDAAVRKLMTVGNGANAAEAKYSAAWDALRNERVARGENVMPLRPKHRPR